MVVLELALLHIEPPADTTAAPPNPLTPALLADLTHALGVLHASASANAAASTHPFTLLQQHEDPSTLYILGSWPSLQAHAAFLPSPANQALLARLAGRIAVPWMLHVAVVPPPDADADADPAAAVKALRDAAPVLAIGRHTVAHAQRAAFQAAWQTRRGVLERAAGRACVGGWRVGRVYGDEGDDEGEDERAVGKDKGPLQQEASEEWVLLSGWDAVERHAAFAASEAFREYAGIREFVAAFDVKHASRVASSD